MEKIHYNSVHQHGQANNVPSCLVHEQFKIGNWHLVKIHPVKNVY